MVTRFPRGLFSKSSKSCFSPAIATADGKLSWKNLAASCRVPIVAKDSNGAKSVRVKEPSYMISNDNVGMTYLVRETN